MLRGVANVWVPVEDIERAFDFCWNTLGFAVIKRDGPWPEVHADGLDIGVNGGSRREHKPAVVRS
jgi:hypothetical protein